MRGELTEYFCMEDVSNYYSHLPRMPERYKERIYYVMNQLANFYNTDGDLVEVDMVDGSKITGILRSDMIDNSPNHYFLIEVWNENKEMPSRGYDYPHEEEDLKKINVTSVKWIKIIKKGNERFPDSFFEAIDELGDKRMRGEISDEQWGNELKIVEQRAYN